MYKRQDLRKIPSIIGGDQKSRHGVVLAKSIPAKRYGIRTGEPVANAFRKCPNLVIEPPDHKMYREKSRMLMDYLRTFTKEIEQVSVDECYVDMTQAMEGFHSPDVYKRQHLIRNVTISISLNTKEFSDMKQERWKSILKPLTLLSLIHISCCPNSRKNRIRSHPK